MISSSVFCYRSQNSEHILAAKPSYAHVLKTELMIKNTDSVIFIESLLFSRVSELLLFNANEQVSPISWRKQVIFDKVMIMYTLY